MIDMFAKVNGIDALNIRLNKVRGKVKNPVELHKRIAGYIFTTFQRNMSKGVDPKGSPLAPVARWTRIARHTAYKGNLIPLLASGRLRNSMNIWDLSDKGVMIGWKGQMLDIATRMIKGTPGYMDVREDPIRNEYSGVRSAKKDGHRYIRVKNDGRWMTKSAPNNSVKVKPKKRNFFYLTPKQVDKALEIANLYIKEAIQA